MQPVLVNGVPVFWLEGPGPLWAGLTFGVGRRDESFVAGGITHLVQRLVMSTVRSHGQATNAEVEVAATQFVAGGPPEQVAEFLRRCCLALTDLPLNALRTEVRVLAADGCAAAQPMTALLLSEAYGCSGAGLAAYNQPGLPGISTEMVRSWTARYFTRQNAVVWAVGPKIDLSLPLPDGEPPARAAQRIRERQLPGWCQHRMDAHVGLGAGVRRTPGAMAALTIMRDRLESDLRYRRGIATLVESDNAIVDATQRFLTTTVHARPGFEAVAATAMWNALTRLATDGPTQAELDADRRTYTDSLTRPDAPMEYALTTALAHVLGHDPISRDTLRAELDALTADDVRLGAATIRDHAILAVPEPTTPQLPGLPRLPESTSIPVHGRAFRPRLCARLPLRSRLIIGDDGVSMLLRGRAPLTVRYDEVTGLVHGARGYFDLASADGTTIALDANQWRAGPIALATISAAVPQHLQVPHYPG